MLRQPFVTHLSKSITNIGFPDFPKFLNGVTTGYCLYYTSIRYSVQYSVRYSVQYNVRYGVQLGS